ncbi:uncharacterized protein METZ01_LOCUS278068, partial [marine metagenome]
MEKEFIMIMERMFDNAILASGSEWIWIAAVIIIILVIAAIASRGGGGGGGFFYGGGCSSCGSSG